MKTRALTCLLLTLTLAGCGFQLRGSKNIATHIDALTISSESQYGRLSRALEEEMRLQQIHASGSGAWNLTILEEEMEENVLAYSDTNNAATVELELTVRFTATNAKGETVIAPNTERVLRIMEVNNQRRLAMDRESQLLRTEMYREMAANLLRRVDFIAGQQQP